MLKRKLYLLAVTGFLLFESCTQSKNNKVADDLSDSLNTVIATPGDSIPPITDQDHKTTGEEETKAEIVKYQFSGEVMKKGDAWIIRTLLEDKAMTDYLPTNLTQEYQREGLKVEFNGTPGEIPPNVRMAGRPFTITSIRKSN